MRLVAPVALATAGIAVSACGGGSPPPAPGSPQKPLVARQPTGIGGAAGGRSNEATASGSNAAKPGYESLLDSQARHPRSRFTPCNLVTQSQAQRILGAPLQEPIEAAQGPTCIYRSKDGRSFVTLAVQTLDFARLKPRLKLHRRLIVGDRTAYCGTYGRPMLYVPLSGGRVLSVAGRCAIATAFARRAVRQL